MDNSKENIIKQENFEIMQIPEIEIRREHGIELLAGFLAEQKEPFEDNEEAIEWIALSYSHPEYKEEILNKIRKDKSFIKNPEELYEKTINLLKEYEKNAPSLDVIGEIREREEMIPKYKEQIEKSIEYFRPDIKTSNIKNVEIVPCDKVLPRIDTGRGINIGNISFIMSHTENPDNFEHEFLHSIINPITEKFANYFEGDEQKQKIFNFVGDRLESYGDYPVSVLNEEIIQTYNIYIKSVEEKGLLFEMRKRIELMKDNELRKRLFNFFKGYGEVRKSDESMYFEKYFSENYSVILD